MEQGKLKILLAPHAAKILRQNFNHWEKMFQTQNSESLIVCKGHVSVCHSSFHCFHYAQAPIVHYQLVALFVWRVVSIERKSTSSNTIGWRTTHKSKAIKQTGPHVTFWVLQIKTLKGPTREDAYLQITAEIFNMKFTVNMMEFEWFWTGSAPAVKEGTYTTPVACCHSNTADPFTDPLVPTLAALSSIQHHRVQPWQRQDNLLLGWSEVIEGWKVRKKQLAKEAAAASQASFSLNVFVELLQLLHQQDHHHNMNLYWIAQTEVSQQPPSIIK